MKQCYRLILALVATTATAAIIGAGCKATQVATRAATTVGVATGTIDPQQAAAINRTTAAFTKAFEDITPEQEYYLGRAVTATLLGTHKVFDHEAATDYINRLGAALALHSDMPETFNGYHFGIMDTDEINAFAAPGGFILISRGLLRCCPNEEAVAAVLAHEIAHVQHRHGLRAIKTGRWSGAAQTAFIESAKTLGSDQVAALTGAMENSIGDITDTLVNSGYSRRQEREADQSAIEIMLRAGYNSRGLRLMLDEMGEQLTEHTGGFGATHPSPSDRIRDIRSLLRDVPEIEPNSERERRFRAALSGI